MPRATVHEGSDCIVIGLQRIHPRDEPFSKILHMDRVDADSRRMADVLVFIHNQNLVLIGDEKESDVDPEA